MLEGGDPNVIVGVIKVLGVDAASQQTLFYCLRLPIYPMLGGGDPNALLGVKKSKGLMLLRSKLFLLSPAPNLSNARGGDPKAILGIKSPGG